MALKKDKPLISIIDDDPNVCLSIKRLLSAVGMEAQTFASGGEFLDLLNTTPSFKPDCVILDVQMPDVSGLAVQIALRRRRSGTPVIFVTASSERWIYEQTQAAGAVGFFNKPFDADVLIAAVRIALGAR